MEDSRIGSAGCAAEPLPFPQIDGPDRRLAADEPAPMPGMRAPSATAWPLAPALTGALCGVALLSTLLRDVVKLSTGWTLALTMAVAAGLALMLVRHLARPVKALASEAERLTRHFTGPAIRRGPNDMANLIHSLDAMTGAFLGQIERLRRLQMDELHNSLDLQRQYALMRLLRGLSEAAFDAHTLELVLERAVQELGEYLDWPLGRVLLCSDPLSAHAERRSVWFCAERRRYAALIDLLQAASSESEHGMTGRACVTGMPHWVTDLANLPGWPQRDAFAQFGLKSGFAIPVCVGGAPRGFIEFFADHRVEASAEMLELIEAVQTELWRIGERRSSGSKLPPGVACAAAASKQLEAIE